MAVQRISEELYLVNLDLPLDGFRGFLGSWVWKRGGRALVVDPGPRSTVPRLLAALEELGVGAVEWILLTHIHIDHAGGAGLLLERYPEARVVCHAEGVRHAVEPSKLWAGSVKVLGSLAEAYGEIAPIPEGRIRFLPAFSFQGLEVAALETPGHAPHHVCYVADGTLFAGEAAGTRSPFGEEDDLRPATPPVFIYETYRGSLEKVSRLAASRLCFGHYGHSDEPARVVGAALSQLERWMEVIAGYGPEFPEGWEERALEELAAKDPCLSGFTRLPEDVAKRERYFAVNSLRGIQGYLEEKGRV
ncbi:MAG: MBL fold metallo-hydrolase [Deltaproteobacteria bacterium]|nr:MBL fold metallo-hydrolase [Deltaproteobacteria bacterium]